MKSSCTVRDARVFMTPLMAVTGPRSMDLFQKPERLRAGSDWPPLIRAMRIGRSRPKENPP